MVKVTSCGQDRVCTELFPGLLTTGYRTGHHVQQALATKTRKVKVQCAGMASELLKK